jgi:hypothetical protein
MKPETRTVTQLFELDVRYQAGHLYFTTVEALNEYAVSEVLAAGAPTA